MLPLYENWASAFHTFAWPFPHDVLPHIHPELELMYVVEGAIDATVHFEEYHLTAGDLVVAFPHEIHSFSVPADPPAHHKIWGMVIHPSLAGDYEPLLSQMVARSPYFAASDLPDEAHNAIRQMNTRHYRSNPLLTKGYLQVLLSYIWKGLQPEPVGQPPTEDILHRVIDYMTTHFREPLRAADVAATLGISTSYLARTFSKRLCMNFNEYLNRLRVQAAEELLAATPKPVTDVMLEVGFESQSTFNRVFRETYGCPPREYRQRRQW